MSTEIRFEARVDANRSSSSFSLLIGLPALLLQTLNAESARDSVIIPVALSLILSVHASILRFFQYPSPFKAI